MARGYSTVQHRSVIPSQRSIIGSPWPWTQRINGGTQVNREGERRQKGKGKKDHQRSMKCWVVTRKNRKVSIWRFHTKDRLHTILWFQVYFHPLCVKLSLSNKGLVEVAQCNYRVIQYFYLLKAFTLNPKSWPLQRYLSSWQSQKRRKVWSRERVYGYSNDITRLLPELFAGDTCCGGLFTV